MMTYATENKKRNRNAIRSKKLLIDAYVKLMQIMPSEKITVTAIVNEAGLNRSTFYAHFERVEDILEYIGGDIVENLSRIVNELNQELVITDPLPMMLRVSEFIEERADFFKKLVDSSVSESFMYELKEMIVARLRRDIETAKRVSDEKVLDVNLRFIAGGYIAVCCDWLKGKINMPLRDISVITAKTMKSGIFSYFE